MKIGMLWQDEDAIAGLPQKVQRAVDYYLKKYDRAPNRCFVHPSQLPDEAHRLIGPVELCGNPSVRPNHFWIGFQSGED